MKIIKEQAINFLTKAISISTHEPDESREDIIERLNKNRTLLKSAIHLINKL